MATQQKAVDPTVIVQILKDIENLLPGGSPPSTLADVTALLIAGVSLAVGLGAFGNTTAQTLVAIIPTAVVVVWRVTAHVIAALHAGHKATVAAAAIRARAGQ